MKTTCVQCLIAILLMAPAGAFAQNYIRNTVEIDSPTAFTIEKGTYQVSFLGYDNGGMELKTFIGLHNNLFLGVSFDMQNAIGKDKPKPNVPGVIAKLKFTDGWETFPISIAAGYDSFYIGEAARTENADNELNRMIYGPYFVVTKPIYLLNDEQHISVGIRTPTQPHYVPKDTAYFVGLDVPLGQYFIFKAESERIYYNFRRAYEWLWNLGMRYSYMGHLAIEFDILLQSREPANRIIRIEYNDAF
ncbi:MAG: hypothetical protein EPN93_02635 [Spirochaetes bacterium]|nr:MAG: hypothetical protein EPN93_02635 [Spirochaetota bacterium]